MIEVKLKKNQGLFRRFTGLEIEKFEELLAKLQPIYADNEKKRPCRKNRFRKIGGWLPIHPKS